MRVRYKGCIYNILKAVNTQKGLYLYYMPTSQSERYAGNDGIYVRYLIVKTDSDLNDCRLLDDLFTKGYIDISMYEVKDAVAV